MPAIEVEPQIKKCTYIANEAIVPASCQNIDKANRIARWKEPKYPGAEGTKVDNVAVAITNSEIKSVGSKLKFKMAK